MKPAGRRSGRGWTGRPSFEGAGVFCWGTELGVADGVAGREPGRPAGSRAHPDDSSSDSTPRTTAAGTNGGRRRVAVTVLPVSCGDYRWGSRPDRVHEVCAWPGPGRRLSCAARDGQTSALAQVWT